MPEQQDTLIQDSVPVEQQSQDATTTNTATTDTSATDATTATTDTTTGTQEVVLTQNQYDEIVSIAQDSNMIENALLTVLVGLLIGYIAVRGLFDAWRS